MDNNRIIWVDDKLEIDRQRFNEVNALKDEGFEVVTYTSAMDFMEDFNKNSSKYVCAIIDLILPSDVYDDLFETGLNLIKMVRVANQEIKIIAYTIANIDDDVRLEFVENKVIHLNKYRDNIVKTIKSIFKS